MDIKILKELLTLSNIKQYLRLLIKKGPRYIFAQACVALKIGQASYMKISKHTSPSKDKLSIQSKTHFNYEPLISILVPAYHTPQKFFRDMINSVQLQSYTNWELIIADANVDRLEMRDYSNQLASTDQRIHIIELSKNLGISENTNIALKEARGDYIALLDHDDLLTPDALFEMVQAINNTSADFLYSDEDKTEKKGTYYYAPHFKSDFNLDLFRSINYICHLVCIKTSLVLSVGGFRSSYDGAQDYDLFLRCVEKASHIYHVPKVLYHWRSHSASTASDPSSKLYAFDAGKEAINDHLIRCHLHGSAEITEYPGSYKIQYELLSFPKISIIIPNRDHLKLLQKCIASILSKSTYKNYEILIVENNSTDSDIFSYYEKLSNDGRIRVITWKHDFNFAAINNYAVQNATGEYVLLLNNDTEIITPDWIEQMLMYAQRLDVGAVGAKLLYPDHTIQHAGAILGINGIVGHSHKYMPDNIVGYFNRPNLPQDLSCVTAACLMVKKSLYIKLSGLDEQFQVAFNDIDFCLRIRKTGLLVVYTPYACLFHYESKSRGSDESPDNRDRFNQEIQLFQVRWHNELSKGDPYYNPNLSLLHENFSLKPTFEKKPAMEH